LIKRELATLNQCAVCSLEEGLEETLTLHRLGLFPKLGISFKVTSRIENIIRQVGDYSRSSELLEKQWSKATTVGRNIFSRNRTQFKNSAWILSSQRSKRGREELEF